jgi:hypothetical protein
MSEDQIKKLLDEAAANSRDITAKLEQAAKLKGAGLTDDELKNAAGGWGGSSTACAACILTTPVATPGSLAGSTIAATNE